MIEPDKLRVEGKLKGASAALEHARLIHFSLLLVAATVLYLAASSYNEAPELHAELERMRSLAEAAGLPNGQQLFANDWPRDLPSPVDETRESFMRALGPHLVWDDESTIALQRGIQLPDKLPEQWRDPHSAPLSDVRKGLAARLQSIAIIRDLKSQPDINVWINSAYEKKFNLLSFSVLKPQTSSSATELMQLEVELLSRCYREGSGPRGAHCVRQSRKFIMQFSSNQQYELEETWFQKAFPRAEGNWRSIYNRSFADALKWADTERLAHLKSVKSNLLGLEVQGRDLGLVGPPALLVLLLYLKVFVEQARSIVVDQLEPEHRDGLVSPWVGAINDPWAKFILMASLSLALGAGSFCLWRITSYTFAILFALLAAWPSYRVAWTAMSLGYTLSQRPQSLPALDTELQAKPTAPDGLRQSVLDAKRCTTPTRLDQGSDGPLGATDAHPAEQENSPGLQPS